MIHTYLRKFALVCTLPIIGALAGCSAEKNPWENEGENEGENAPEIVASDENTNPLLYEIANPNGEFEGWMLGTIHALPDDTNWRTPAIELAIADADRLLVEIAGLGDQSRIAGIFTELATTPDLGPLPARVTPELREDLVEMMALSGIAADEFEDTENWAAAIMLASVGAVGEPRNGVDRYVISRFEPGEVVGVETPSQQLGIFDRLAPKDQRDLLEETVREWIASRDNPGKLTRAWLAGDADALTAATNTGMMADTELHAALLVDRNVRWIPMVIANMQETRSILIAVGAAHIVGPNGLPSMLESRGYTVSRVN